MNNMIRFKPQVPGYLQPFFNRYQREMEQITDCAILAMEEQSMVVKHAFLQTISTVNTITLLQEASQANGRSTEVDFALDQIMKQYLTSMGQIPAEAGSMFLQKLQELCSNQTGNGFFQNFWNNITHLLPG